MISCSGWNNWRYVPVRTSSEKRKLLINQQIKNSHFLPTTVGSRSTITALGTCFPAPVSEKNVLKESSPAPMALSDGIFKGRNLINCERSIINNDCVSASPGHRAGCRARGSTAPSTRYQSGLRPGRCGQRCTHATMRKNKYKLNLNNKLSIYTWSRNFWSGKWCYYGYHPG